MNKLVIIGNLTGDPELRTTSNGKSVCSFSVAVNRKKKVDGKPEADFFRVSAWGALGENCAKFLAKGRKVSVVGAVSIHTYESHGETKASLDIEMAEDVEFLSPRSESVDRETGYQKVQVKGDPFAQQLDMDTPY